MLASAGLYCSLVAPRELRMGRQRWEVLLLCDHCGPHGSVFWFFFFENKRSDNVILAGIQLGESQAVRINLLWLLGLQTEMGCCVAALTQESPGGNYRR